MNWICSNGVWVDGAGRPIPAAPLQAYVPYGRTPGIPMQVAEEAWKEYDAQGYGSQSLARLNQRGGFEAAELAILLYERIQRLQQQLGKS
jgi:hypothetical protein